MLAVQSQDYPGARWALGVRTANTTDDAVNDAFAEGKFLRTHVMRPTWHFVLPDDIRWLLELTASRVHQVNGHRYRALELDADALTKCAGLLVDALRDGNYRTRPEIKTLLEQAGIDASGQRLAYILMHAELEGLICSGPPRGKQQTYAVLEERAPGARRLTRDEALAELADRYFTSHGPALVHDLARWSGLTVADAGRAIELAGPRLMSENLDGLTYWFSASMSRVEADPPPVHLLPILDEYQNGYKDHRFTFDPTTFVTAGWTPDTFGRYFLVVDGLIAGNWRRTVKSKRVYIEVNPLVVLSDAHQQALQDAVENYGAFLELDVDLDVASPSTRV